MSEADDFLAALERDQLVRAVNDELRLYARGGNGLAVWRAYRMCREAGVPVPEVILKCFDKMGAALESADGAQAVAAALEMEGRGYGGSARKHMHRVDRTFAVVSHVHLLMNLPRPMGKNEASRRVAARFGMTAPAVERMYERWLKGPDEMKRRKRNVKPTKPRGPFDW